MWGVYMINIFFILIFVTAIAAVSLGVRYTLHMFQQSYYQYRSYWRYMKTHPAMTLLPLAGVAVLAGWLAVRKSLAAVVVILSLEWICLLLLVFLYWPRAAKKKLIITARVKRLIAATAALYLLACLAASLMAGISWPLLLVSAMLGAMLSPYMVLLANLINRPI